MSSIYQAVAADLRGGRPSRGNPIVQNDRSFRDDGNINADIEKQRQTEALIRKQARMQEGGRGGGYNDRQDIATRDKRAAEAENGYDDFGRRVVKREGDKKQRAQAALDRLRKKTAGAAEEDLKLETDDKKPPREETVPREGRPRGGERSPRGEARSKSRRRRSPSRRRSRSRSRRRKRRRSSSSSSS
eukprot:s2644_g8.t1